MTGFDLPRLFVGSLGVFGFVGDVMLRTQPIPPSSQWLSVTGAEPIAVRDSSLAVAAALWDGETTWVLLEGHPHDVSAGRQELAALGSVSPVEGPPTCPPFRRSATPSEALHLMASGGLDGALADVGTGLIYQQSAPPQPTLPAVATALNRRMKASLDPTNRCNPGRVPWPTEQASST